MATFDSWGGSWGTSWALSWTGEEAVAAVTGYAMIVEAGRPGSNVVGTTVRPGSTVVESSRPGSKRVE